MRHVLDSVGHMPHDVEVVLREPKPGELRWVVARHGALYAQECGWDETFEQLAARIVADFATEHGSKLVDACVAFARERG